MEEWQELSRDPRHLNAFIENLGSSGVEVEEIYNLDSLEDPKQIHGIVLLYSWNPLLISDSLYTSPDICSLTLLDPKLSLTLALLTILFNTDIKLSPELQKFKETILPLPPKLRSVAIHNSSKIRQLQSTLSNPSPKARPMFFSTLFPKSGKVVEIDGLTSGPILLSDVAEDDWLERTKHILTERISKFHQHEVEFSIFMILNNKKLEAEQSIQSLQRKLQTIHKKLGSKVSDYDAELLDSLHDDPESLNMELLNYEESKQAAEALIKSEDQKYENWQEENSRRKHNFVPFISSFLQKLEQKKQLSQLFDRALKKKLVN